MRKSVLIAVLVVVALALVGCGGGNSGKALALEAVKAIEAKDEPKLKEVGDRFDELGPVQKARFAAELAKHGEEVAKALAEIVDLKLGQ